MGKNINVALAFSALFLCSMLLLQDYNESAYADIIVHYTITDDDNGNSISGNTNHEKCDGERVLASSALIGDRVTEMSIRLFKSSTTLTGNVYVAIWDVASGSPTSSNMKRLIATEIANSLPTSPLDFEYNFLPYTIALDDYIGICYFVDGGSSNWVSLRYSTNTQFDAANTENYNVNQAGSFTEPAGTTDIVMILQDNDEAFSEICIDTNADGVGDACFSDTNGDGIPDASGAFAVTRAGQNITTTSSNLACQVGIVECDPVTGELDNPDVKTNGIGFLLTLLLLLLVLGLMTFVLHRSKTPITEVPYPVWIIYVVGVVGASAGLQWIDAVYWYASIVAGIVMPATGAIYNKIRSG